MKNWKNFDWWLLALPVGIVGFSCLMLYKLSQFAPTVPASTPVKQAVYLGIGLVLFWFFASTDYKLLRPFVLPAYVVVVLSLLVVAVVGHTSFGATRWVNLGFIQLQPSEPAKLAVVLLLSKFLSDREYRMAEPSTIAGALLIAGVPALIVLKEPDFGSAMVFVAVLAGLLIMASTPAPYLAGLTVLAGAATPVIWLKVLKPYQTQRLTAFLHPTWYLRTWNYNPFHAQLAIGSGGPWGLWFGRQTQARLNFITVPGEDFIFSVVAEQIGFFGVLGLFAVIAALLFRIARVAYISADSFGRLIASGLLVMLLFQMFLNVGVNMGIMPVTGIPLPLLSYGGSSLITTLAGLGILESILLRHQKLVFSTGESIL